MSYDRRFTQKDYNILVGTLDTALDVFKETAKSDKDAEAALRDFVLNHYFKVWREMARA